MEADQGTYDQTLNQIELERNIKFYTNEEDCKIKLCYI